MPDSEDVSDTSKKKVCIFCKENIKTTGVKCSKCNTCIHSKCFEQVAKYFVIERLNWCCKSCATMKDGKVDKSCKIESADMNIIINENKCLNREIELLKKLVAEQEYINSLQKEKIEYLSAKSVSTPITEQSESPTSYSNIVKTQISTQRKNNTPQSSHTLLIKANRENANKSDIIKDIKNNANLAELNVCVTNTKKINNGILVNCENKLMLDKLKSNLHEKIGDRYKINEATKYKPRLKIKNVEEDTLDDKNSFLNDLIIRNNLPCQPSDIKIVFMQIRKQPANVIIEVSPSIRKLILNCGYLFVGWKKCGVEDHYSVTRCYKCSKYNHLKEQCDSELACPVCAGHHELKNCQADFKKCINCLDYNNRNKTNIPVDHMAKDTSCHVYKLMLDRIISKTNFND